MQVPETTQLTGKLSITAVLYLRVSTVEQGRRGFSIPEQRKACLEKAQALARSLELDSGAPVSLETFEFLDTAGGDLLERPELAKAREFVRGSRPHFFICLDPDRFSRATHQAILIANEIEVAGTRLEFVQHDYQASSEGRLFFTLRVAIAEYEKAKILERTTRGKRGKMAAGGIPHRMQVYGYGHIPAAERQVRAKDGQGVDCALVRNPVEAAWVRQMYDWVVQDQVGSMTIAERLNQFGVPAKNGGTWHRGVVNDILHNPIYIGQLRMNRYDFTGLGGQLQLPKERRTKKLTPRIRPTSEWITVPVPAILSEDQFSLVQSVLRRMKRQSGTRMHPDRRGHLLSGLATCGLCGAPMYYVWNNNVNGYLLRCANRYPATRGMKVPPSACPAPHQKASIFEGQAWDKTKEWLMDPDILQTDLERSLAEPSPLAQELVSRQGFLTEQVEATKAGHARVVYLVSKGLVHPEIAEKQLAETKHHLDALEKELEDVRRSIGQSAAKMQSTERVVTRVREVAAEVHQALDSMTLPERQSLLRMIVREARVFPAGKAAVVPVDE